MSNTMIPVSPIVCNSCTFAFSIDNKEVLAYPYRDNDRQWLCITKPRREVIIITRDESTVPPACPYESRHEDYFFFNGGHCE